MSSSNPTTQSWCVVLITPWLVRQVHAFHSFIPNCTAPPEHVNFVFSAQARGTMNIVWSATSALLLCTWAIQHLSVPLPTAQGKSSWNTAFKEKLWFNLKKIKWMGLTILSPEYILGKAVAENLAARYSKMQFKHKDWTSTHGFFANMRGFVLRFDIATVPTSLTPVKGGDEGRKRQLPRDNYDPPYYEQDVEGAIAIELKQCHSICHEPCENRPDADTTKETESASTYLQSSSTISEVNCGIATEEIKEKAGTLAKDTTRQVEVSKMTGEVSSDRPQESVEPLSNGAETDHDQPAKDAEKNTTLSQRPPSGQSSSKKPGLGPHKPWKATWPLNSNQMCYAYETGIIPGPPPITAEEISDRSKGDGLVKTAAVFQLLWLIAQVIARSFEHLATTLIEVTVLAFAACALVTYGFLWYKPQDIKIPVYVDIPGVLTREQVIGLAARCPPSSLIVNEFWLHGVAIRAMTGNVFPYSPGIPFRFSGMKKKLFFSPVVVGIGIGGTLFGSIHFAAWNFDFPTPVERTLWRISCILLLILPLIGTLMYWAALHYARKWGTTDNRVNRVLKPLGYTFIPVYLFARLFLLVEVFRSLAYLPPSAYKAVQWPSLVPYVA
jgi:hypothetical protein